MGPSSLPETPDRSWHFYARFQDLLQPWDSDKIVEKTTNRCVCVGGGGIPGQGYQDHIVSIMYDTHLVLPGQVFPEPDSICYQWKSGRNLIGSQGISSVCPE